MEGGKFRDRFLSIFSLTSRIPIPLAYTFDPSRLDLAFPLVGVFPALLGGIFLFGDPRSGGILPVILGLAVQYLAFNLFHLDGLMDTADAFLGRVGAEKRLAILKDSRIGVYGFFVGLAALSLKAALLLELRPALLRYPGGILAYPISGRISAALVPVLTGPQNDTGLGSLVKDARPGRVFLGGLAALGLWTGTVYGLRFLAARLPGGAFPGFPPSLSGAFGVHLLLSAIPLLSPLPALAIARTYRRGIGGYTGDALGAAVELGELAHLGAAFAVLLVA